MEKKCSLRHASMFRQWKSYKTSLCTICHRVIYSSTAVCNCGSVLTGNWAIIFLCGCHTRLNVLLVSVLSCVFLLVFVFLFVFVFFVCICICIFIYVGVLTSYRAIIFVCGSKLSPICTRIEVNWCSSGALLKLIISFHWICHSHAPQNSLKIMLKLCQREKFNPT